VTRCFGAAVVLGAAAVCACTPFGARTTTDSIDGGPSPPAGPERIVADAAYAYWTSKGGTVERAPLDGGPRVTLAANQNAPIGIAVDRSSVYWANNGSGTIMKVDRCCGL
jgi:hypothetical protein